MHLRSLDMDGSASSQPAPAALTARRRAADRRCSTCASLTRPVSVVHFGASCDWERFLDDDNCGAWVIRALETPHVRRIVTICSCGDDMKRPQMKLGNVGAIREGRLEVHTWKAGTARLWGLPVSAICAERSWTDFLDGLFRSLPTQEVWLTIDKDVLAASEAGADCGEGQTTPGHILATVKALVSHRKILAVDVCGDYSTRRYADPFRALLSWVDRVAVAVRSGADAIKDRKNARLAASFQGAFI